MPGMTAVLIRPAAAGDAAAMAGLHGRCFAEGWDEAAFRALLVAPGALGHLAVAADALAGLALLRIVADEGEVITFAVAPQWRRRGIGSALLAGAAVNNAAAQALYRRAGFVAVGRRRGYYGDGGDAAILARTLAADLSEGDPPPAPCGR
jgi:ribosomal-protein-alanine N-acetyltransferase